MNLLFNFEKTSSEPIQGLNYIPDFISLQEEQELIAAIDSHSWLHDLKRRVQHYGYKYDYKARSLSAQSYIGELPEWVVPIAAKLRSNKIFSKSVDQVIVNEYLPGQGISAHIDCVPCFDVVIASLSLGSPAMMQFVNVRTSEKQDLYLEQRSLVVLASAARYEWTHSIPARKSDIVDGIKVARNRRLSLTFRSVILG